MAELLPPSEHLLLEIAHLPRLPMQVALPPSRYQLLRREVEDAVGEELGEGQLSYMGMLITEGVVH